MSEDTSAMSGCDELAFEANLAKLRRMNAETEKFVAEQRELIAEAAKLDRDRWLAPALAIAAVIGGILGLASFIAKVIG